MNKNKDQSQQVYLSDADLGKRYRVARQTVWSWAKDKGFPRPRKLSPGCTRWLLSEVEQWEERRG